MYITKLNLFYKSSSEHFEQKISNKNPLYTSNINLLIMIRNFVSFMFFYHQKLDKIPKNFLSNMIYKVIPFKEIEDDVKLEKLTLSFNEKSTTDICIEFNKENFVENSIKFWEHYKDLKELPLIVHYHKDFSNDCKRIGKKIQELLSSSFGLSQPQGYYNWNYPKDCPLVWQQYFRMQWMNWLFGHNRNDEGDYLYAINKCLYKAKIGSLELIRDKNQEYLNLKLISKRNLKADNLPKDLNYFFNTVFDIANRSFLLNKNCNPSGICFIEEPEEIPFGIIFRRLQETFPKLQFVVKWN